jgi:CBS domain containing-hemolysin-like protein
MYPSVRWLTAPRAYNSRMQEAGDTGPHPPRAPGPLRRRLARLLVRGADGALRWLTRRLGVHHTAGRESITEAELRDLVAANTVLDREERRLIAEVLAAGTRSVRELIVPRTEVLFLDARLTVTDAVQLVREARHSRFPVIDGSSDDVIGFVHLRDLTIRPAADATPAPTDHIAIARARCLAFGYASRISASVVGSISAAPTPCTSRAPISTPN